MTDRRNFLITSAAFTAGSLILPLSSCEEGKKEIGIQLYSLRDKIAEDLKQTLETVAKIGYNSLEAAGYDNETRLLYGQKPKEFSRMVSDMGMMLNSTHILCEMEIFDRVIADAAEAGVKYAIYPFIFEEKRTSLDDWKNFADMFNKMGEMASQYGIRFGYHNHAFEFDAMDGIIPMDLLLQETQPELVTFELDLYWISRAGYDPVEFFKKYPGRFELWHTKDMEDSEDMFFAPVGSGTLDFEKIFKEKETAGMKHFFVEQDRFKEGMDPIDSVRMSYNYLNSAKFV